MNAGFVTKVVYLSTMRNARLMLLRKGKKKRDEHSWHIYVVKIETHPKNIL